MKILRALGSAIGVFILFSVVLTGCGGNNSSPTSAPTAPTNITITPGDAQVTIRWPAVASASSYNIYWSTTTGIAPAIVIKITGATSPYTIAGLTNGTGYSFSVSAVNSNGESTASDQITSVPSPSISVIQSGNNVFTLLASGLNAPRGFQLNVNYDSSSFSNPRVVQGSLTNGALFVANLSVPGVAKIATVSNTPLSGSGPIAIITFDQIGDSPGTITVNGTVVNVAGKTLPVTFNGWYPPDSIATGATATRSIVLSTDKHAATANGIDGVTFTATVRDGNGLPIEGQPVDFQVPEGLYPYVLPSTTDATGSTTIFLKHPPVGPIGGALVTVGASNGGMNSNQITVTFSNPPQSAASVTLVNGKGTLIGDLADRVQLTVTVKDTNGAPIAGQAVTINIPRPIIPLSPDFLIYTDVTGQATVSLEASISHFGGLVAPQTVLVTASSGGTTSDSISITVTQPQ